MKEASFPALYELLDPEKFQASPLSEVRVGKTWNMIFILCH